MNTPATIVRLSTRFLQSKLSLLVLLFSAFFSGSPQVLVAQWSPIVADPGFTLSVTSNDCVDGNPRVALSWTAVSGTDSYYYSRSDNTSRFRTVGTGTTFNDATASDNTQYSYIIEANHGSAGEPSDYSNTVSVTTKDCTPTATAAPSSTTTPTKAPTQTPTPTPKTIVQVGSKSPTPTISLEPTDIPVSNTATPTQAIASSEGDSEHRTSNVPLILYLLVFVGVFGGGGYYLYKRRQAAKLSPNSNKVTAEDMESEEDGGNGSEEEASNKQDVPTPRA